MTGKIILGAYWLMASFNHSKNLNYLSECAKARRTHRPKLAVAGTEIILLLGGISMLLGVYPVIGTILSILLLRGRVVSDAYLREDGRRADEAARHDQFHEEHGLGRGTVEVVTVASPLADGPSERLGMLIDVQPGSV